MAFPRRSGYVYQPTAEWTPVSVDPDHTSRVNAFLSYTREIKKVPNENQADHLGRDCGNLSPEGQRYPRVNIDLSYPLSCITPSFFASLMPQRVLGPEQCDGLTKMRLLLLMCEPVNLNNWNGCVLTGHYEFEARIGPSWQDHLVLGLDFFERFHPELRCRICYLPMNPASSSTTTKGTDNSQDIVKETEPASQDSAQESMDLLGLDIPASWEDKAALVSNTKYETILPIVLGKPFRYAVSSGSNLAAPTTESSVTLPKQINGKQYRYTISNVKTGHWASSFRRTALYAIIHITWTNHKPNFPPKVYTFVVSNH